MICFTLWDPENAVELLKTCQRWCFEHCIVEGAEGDGSKAPAGNGL